MLAFYMNVLFTPLSVPHSRLGLSVATCHCINQNNGVMISFSYKSPLTVPLIPIGTIILKLIHV